MCSNKLRLQQQLWRSKIQSLYEMLCLVFVPHPSQPLVPCARCDRGMPLCEAVRQQMDIWGGFAR